MWRAPDWPKQRNDDELSTNDGNILIVTGLQKHITAQHLLHELARLFDTIRVVKLDTDSFDYPAGKLRLCSISDKC